MRQFAHFWPIEARAIGDVGVAVACDGHHEGDLIVATLELDHDETLPIMIDMPSSHVSEMFQVLYWDIELQEDRLITVHDNDTTEFLACGLYDERVRNQYRDRDAELEDE